MIYLFLSIKINQVRFDYFFSVLPIFLILISYILVKGVDLLVKEFKSAEIISYILACYLILLILPSFISNLLIDGDRLNWKETANYIKQQFLENEIKKPIDIYSTEPGKLEYYLEDYSNDIQNKQLRAFNMHIRDHKKVFVIIPLRRSGFDIRNISKSLQNSIFKNGRLIKIIGKNRLDIHVNKLAILEIE